MSVSVVTDARFTRGLRTVVRVLPWFWLSAVVLLGCWFVRKERDRAEQVWEIIRGAQLTWIGAALVLALFILGLHGLTYRSALRRLGHSLQVQQLVGVHLLRVLIGSITPVGGPPSLYIFVRRLERFGVPSEDALLAATLRSVAGYGALVALLAPAMLLPAFSPGLRMAAVALIVAFGGLIALLGRVFRGEGLAEHRVRWLPTRLRAFADRLTRRRVTGRDIVLPAICAVGIRLGGAALLYVCLRAVDAQPAISTAVIAYVAGVLTLIVAPVFQGVGVVEVSVAVALERLGVSPAAAISAALLARVGELWLPMLLGCVVHGAALTRGPDVSDARPSTTRLERPIVFAPGPNPQPQLQPVPVKVRARS